MTERSTRLSPEACLAALRADGARLAALAEQALDRPVPSCPGWSVRDVVLHTAEVYQHKLACIRLGMRPEHYESVPPDGVEPVRWFRESLAELLSELERRGPDAPAYTWWPLEQTVGFWYRRMAQETAVHRVDVETAVDAMTPVDAALAVDGIDEVPREAVQADGDEGAVAALRERLVLATQ